jgi:AraC family transcriptional regulator
MQDRTPDLWRSFMPHRNTVVARSGDGFISMQVYPQGPAQVADPKAAFTKWAMVEVENNERSTEGMQPYTLQGGEYAVFDHHGPATDMSTVMYIFQQWLPNSEYELDDREHFERLPEGYSPMDSDAREEFWIPVKPR